VQRLEVRHLHLGYLEYLSAGILELVGILIPVLSCFPFILHILTRLLIKAIQAYHTRVPIRGDEGLDTPLRAGDRWCWHPPVHPEEPDF
jgi:hypothetical protein